MVGKRLLDDLYVHISAVGLCEHLPTWVSNIREHLPTLEGRSPNVLKFNLVTYRYSLLLYPGFEAEPFPALLASWSYSKGSDSPTFRRYDGSLNPPILHRKELLVEENFSGRQAWVELTELLESLGLFDETKLIGFQKNWLQLISAKGYQVQGQGLVPLANVEVVEDGMSERWDASQATVQRHLTALSRSSLSAPVQMLIRFGMLTTEQTYFDYGCGRGTDVEGLRMAGYTSCGWDPYYAPSEPVIAADVVNLGFVINVIEDPAERAEALHRAFKLTKGLLSVSVMLDGSFAGGVPYSDGVLTSRQTFQKYFTQAELKDYIEHALGITPVMVAPGIAWVFADQTLEQRYLAGRYRRPTVVERLNALSGQIILPRRVRETVRRTNPSDRAELQFNERKPYLDKLWQFTLDLGRWPEPEELQAFKEELQVIGGWSRARRLLMTRYPAESLKQATQQRRDDVLIYLITQLFSRRPQYKKLDRRLQLDVRAHFGDMQSALSIAVQQLQRTAQPLELLSACVAAAEQGLGCLSGDHDLQLHVNLVERLPLLLRAYVACGLLLWDASSEVQLVKIHIQSGKLSLMEYGDVDFVQAALPRLKRRIKVNMRRLQCEVFEYGDGKYPMPLLFWKADYLHEEMPGYPEQQAFDESLAQTMLVVRGEKEPSAVDFYAALERKRLRVDRLQLVPSDRIPDLDQPCGENFTYRDFIECGETQQQLKLQNAPRRPETYNALYALATQVLDPLIDYFGGIRLTYGFCGAALGKYIKARVAPKLDQHASCELNASGQLICDRQGAACDFVVDDEDMRQVAQWIIDELPFDRLYFYGESRPLHVSVGPQAGRQAFEMVPNVKGHLTPRSWRTLNKE